MDIFKFNTQPTQMNLKEGQIINGLKSKLWVERYSKAGEFKLTAEASVKMRKQLPVGSLISHVNSTEVMIVESHEINDDRGKEPKLTITGSSFESYFENRIVGSNKTFPTSSGISDYILPLGTTWDQAVLLIKNHIDFDSLIDKNNEIPFVSVISFVTEAPGSTVAERSLKRGDLYSRLIELLQIDNLGVKLFRPGPRSPLGMDSEDLVVVIHSGVDRSKDLIFSHELEDIENADYFWTNKTLKNAAMIAGKWVETVVTTGPALYNRRMMYIDASDIDNHFKDQPTISERNAIAGLMQERGRQALAAQKNIALTKAEVSKRSNSPVYRRDFNVGDLVSVRGEYNENATMRIGEYVEVEDEHGEQGYPTLSEV